MVLSQCAVFEDRLGSTGALHVHIALWGLTSAKNRDKFYRFQSKVVRMGHLPKTSKAFAEKVEEAEKRLFRSIEYNTNHMY